MRRLVGLVVLSGGKDCRLWDVKASVTSKWRIAGWIEAATRAVTRCIYSACYCVGWLIGTAFEASKLKESHHLHGEMKYEV